MHLIKIGAGTLKLRREIKNKVEKAIRNKYGDRFKVEFFGSIQYVD
jgi:hypothetical protein